MKYILRCGMAGLILFLLPILAMAQEQTTLVITEDFGEQPLDSLFWFHESKDQSLSFELLTAEPSQEAFFRPNEKKLPSFGFSDSTWWARALLENASSKPRTLFISLGYTAQDSVEFFLQHNGKLIKSTRSGDRSRNSRPDISYRLPTLKVELPPGSSKLFIRIQSKGPINFGTMVFSEGNFHKNHLFEYVFILAIISILLVMALYNFFIFAQLRKTVYLLYIAFISMMIYQSFCFSGLLWEAFPTIPFLYNEAYMMALHLTNFFALLFALHFLSLKNRKVWLYRACLLGCVMTLLGFALALVSYNLTAKLSVPVTAYTALTVLTCGVSSAINRFRPAYFFSAAWVVILFAALVRTLAIIGILPLSFVVDWGPFIGSVIEVILISMALADKVRITEQLALAEIADLNSKLKQENAKVVALNETLAERVEEQTREVNSILKHIQMGILVAKGSDHTITATYSDSVAEIFETSDIEGRNVIDFLFSGAKTTSEVKSMARNVLASCLNEDIVNAEFNLHLLPRQLEYRFGDQDRIFEIEWNPVMNDGLVEKMMMTIKDVTLMRKMERETAEKSKELSFIGEILEVPVAQFNRFMDSSQRFLADNERLIRANRRFNPEILKILFINLHTIKGTARALGFKNLTPLVHDAEQDLAAIISGDKIWNQNEILENLLVVKMNFDLYQDLNLKKLGRTMGNTLTISVEYAQQLLRFLHRIHGHVSVENKHGLKSIQKTMEDLLFVRAETIFSEVLANAEMLARDLGKEQPRISIQDSGVMLSKKGQELIRNVFIHVIRNSMDHGIENAKERLKAGKDAAGRIDVTICAQKGHLKISFQDDGRGLNLPAIRRLAEEKGLVKPSDGLSPLEICYLIFEAGLSTCNELSEISGRGMGMSAVKEYIEEQNGLVHIRLVNPGESPELDHQNFILEFELDEECLGTQAA